MIFDCHTHVWESAEQLGKARLAAKLRHHRGPAALSPPDDVPDASVETHLAASEPVDRAFVFGFRSRYLEADIPNRFVADYVRQHPTKLIGVAGIDPTNLTEATEALTAAHEQFGMKGITVSPAAQDFHPADSRAMQVYAEAAKLRMPVFVHQGIHFSVASKMEFARPVMLDEVARDLPNLKLVVAHLGYPWVEECIVLLGKHPNVYADISALMHRPWQAYNALLSAYQYGVMDKLLFGSDFLYTAGTAAIASLYRLNQLVTGTNLPTVPRAQLEGIVERDALYLLGIDTPTSAPSGNKSALLDAHD